MITKRTVPGKRSNLAYRPVSVALALLVGKVSVPARPAVLGCHRTALAGRSWAATAGQPTRWLCFRLRKEHQYCGIYGDPAEGRMDSY